LRRAGRARERERVHDLGNLIQIASSALPLVGRGALESARARLKAVGFERKAENWRSINRNCTGNLR
jgi:hypothetical protein